MDLLSFDGKKMLFDLGSAKTLIEAVEKRLKIKVDNGVIYKDIFSAIDDLSLVEEELETIICDLEFYGSIEDENVYAFLSWDDVDLFRSTCVYIARILIEQLKNAGAYDKGILCWHYRGELSPSTGVLFEKRMRDL